ncbi:hypothetical protein HDV03_005116 [Kappamyces sp. JEL0829]|nr:hypothetical protein HDV03_005116 [Kappamyces sp. JEL0829]
MEAIEVVPEVLPFARVEGEPSLTVSNITNKDFVLKPVAPMTKVCCRLERMTSPFATSFNFYLENHAEASELLIMTAEKHFGLDARYSIKTTEHNRELLLGKVKTNILGTSCSIMQLLGGLEYEEVACVDYETKITTQKSPRKFNVIIPSLGIDQKPLAVHGAMRQSSLSERVKSGNDQRFYQVLSNKTPQWNQETRSYTLNFNGRVNVSSVKNFQIVHPDDKEYITLQSGRINDHSFNVDIRYPFTLFQALGIVLTSFDPKLTSE